MGEPAVILRDFQQAAYNEAYEAWHAGHRNVMIVLPTGGGKTVVFTKMAADGEPTAIVSHRGLLVSQHALALNEHQVPHGVIGPKELIKAIVKLEMDTHGRSYYSPRAPVRVVSVDSVGNRDHSERWYVQVKKVVQDEAHHVLARNKWGATMPLFPNAVGAFFTAHAVRADGAGLGRHADGLVDHLIVGPCGRDLIGRGFLTDYRLACPPSDIDVSEVPVGSTGDFVLPKLRAQVHKSRTIVGSVVDHYINNAYGKLGITFAVDVEAAKEFAVEYERKGIHCAVITDETPIGTRGKIMERFRAREILMLISVDVLGEGVDVPAIEVVHLVRHTQSWQLMCQQFGRALRIMVDKQYNDNWHTYTDAQRLAIIAASRKPQAMVFDHVGNIARHYEYRGLPDSRQSYSLNRVEKAQRKKKDDAIPLTVCLNPICNYPYKAFLSRCPVCGTPKPMPASRSTPDQVEGVLQWLDPEAIRSLLGEIAKVDGPALAYGNDAAANSIRKNHVRRQDAQSGLRPAIALWAGYQRHMGLNDVEIQAMFYYLFHVDIATAQTLSANDAIMLQCRVTDWLFRNNVRAA